MLVKLHFNGAPVFRVDSVFDCTEYQRYFLELGVVEHINEERSFLMKLFGAESGDNMVDGGVRGRAEGLVKHPPRRRRN